MTSANATENATTTSAEDVTTYTRHHVLLCTSYLPIQIHLDTVSINPSLISFPSFSSRTTLISQSLQDLTPSSVISRLESYNHRVQNKQVNDGLPAKPGEDSLSSLTPLPPGSVAVDLSVFKSLHPSSPSDSHLPNEVIFFTGGEFERHLILIWNPSVKRYKGTVWGNNNFGFSNWTGWIYKHYGYNWERKGGGLDIEFGISSVNVSKKTNEKLDRAGTNIQFYTGHLEGVINLRKVGDPPKMDSLGEETETGDFEQKQAPVINWQSFFPAKYKSEEPTPYYYSSTKVEVLFDFSRDAYELEAYLGERLSKSTSFILRRCFEEYASKLPIICLAAAKIPKYQTPSRPLHHIHEDLRPRCYLLHGVGRWKDLESEKEVIDDYEEKPIAVICDLVGAMDGTPPRSVETIQQIRKYFTRDRKFSLQGICFMSDSKAVMKVDLDDWYGEPGYWNKFEVKDVNDKPYQEESEENEEVGGGFKTIRFWDRGVFETGIEQEKWESRMRFHSRESTRSLPTPVEETYRYEDYDVERFVEAADYYQYAVFAWTQNKNISYLEIVSPPDMLYHANVPQIRSSRFATLAVVMNSLGVVSIDDTLPARIRSEALLAYGCALLHGYTVDVSSETRARGIEAIRKASNLGNIRAHRLVCRLVPGLLNPITSQDPIPAFRRGTLYCSENMVHVASEDEWSPASAEFIEGFEETDLHSFLCSRWGAWVIYRLKSFASFEEADKLEVMRESLASDLQIICEDLIEYDEAEKAFFVSIPDNNPEEMTCFGTLLHAAAALNVPSAILPLINGEDTENITNRVSIFPSVSTPLLAALRYNNPTIAHLLLEKGASPHPIPPSRTSRYILSPPLPEGDLWRWHAQPSPLHHLVYITDEEEAIRLAEKLASLTADVNIKASANLLNEFEEYTYAKGVLLDGESATPLEVALAHGKFALARKLLELGAGFAEVEFYRWQFEDLWKPRVKKSECVSQYDGGYEDDDEANPMFVTIFPHRGNTDGTAKKSKRRFPILTTFPFDQQILETYYSTLLKASNEQIEQAMAVQRSETLPVVPISSKRPVDSDLPPIPLSHSPLGLFLRQSGDIRYILQWNNPDDDQLLDMFEFLLGKELTRSWTLRYQILSYAIGNHAPDLIIKHLLNFKALNVPLDGIYQGLTPALTAIYFDRLSMLKLLLAKDSTLLSSYADWLLSKNPGPWTLLAHRLPHSNPANLKSYIELFQIHDGPLPADPEALKELVYTSLLHSHIPLLETIICQAPEARYFTTVKPFIKHQSASQKQQYAVDESRQQIEDPIVSMLLKCHAEFEKGYIKQVLRLFLPAQPPEEETDDDDSPPTTPAVSIAASSEWEVVETDAVSIASLSPLQKEGLIENRRGTTPFHIAAQHPRLLLDDEICSILLSSFDINQPDKAGDTPLHYTAHIEDPTIRTRMIQKLLDLGANPEKKNNHGLTALDSVCVKRLFRGRLRKKPVPKDWIVGSTLPSSEDAEVEVMGYDDKFIKMVDELASLGLKGDERLMRFVRSWDKGCGKAVVDGVVSRREEFDMWFYLRNKVESGERKGEDVENVKKAIEEGKREFGDGSVGFWWW